jgi:hypothetical protein
MKLSHVFAYKEPVIAPIVASFMRLNDFSSNEFVEFCVQVRIRGEKYTLVVPDQLYQDLKNYNGNLPVVLWHRWITGAIVDCTLPINMQ